MSCCDARPSAAQLDGVARAHLQPILQALDGVAYVVDADGWVLQAGAPMSQALGVEEPGPSRPLAGQNLFDVIRGREVQAAYRTITDRVLGGAGATISFEYRCDAPDVRRLMRMSIGRLQLPAAPPLALYQSQVLSAVHRPWMSLFEPERILDYVKSESGLPIIRMCSICQKVSWPDLQPGPVTWLEGDDYYRRGGPADMRISHVVCPPCADRLDVH